MDSELIPASEEYFARRGLASRSCCYRYPLTPGDCANVRPYIYKKTSVLRADGLHIQTQSDAINRNVETERVVTSLTIIPDRSDPQSHSPAQPDPSLPPLIPQNKVLPPAKQQHEQLRQRFATIRLPNRRCALFFHLAYYQHHHQQQQQNLSSLGVNVNAT
jgi:hypothetical protein